MTSRRKLGVSCIFPNSRSFFLIREASLIPIHRMSFHLDSKVHCYWVQLTSLLIWFHQSTSDLGSIAKSTSGFSSFSWIAIATSSDWRRFAESLLTGSKSTSNSLTWVRNQPVTLGHDSNLDSWLRCGIVTLFLQSELIEAWLTQLILTSRWSKLLLSYSTIW